MKKRICCKRSAKLLCVLTVGLFLLSACGKTEEKDMNGTVIAMESHEIGSDFEYQDIAESEIGYYFWECRCDDHINPRLMFMDKESGRVVPLCNKPDCMHDGKDCNAYFPEMHPGQNGVDKHYLQYYDGNLYAVGLSPDNYVALFCIKEDGSEWEINAKLYRTDYMATGHWKSPEILIHDGYVYMVDVKQEMMKLERIPVGGGTAEVLFEGDDDAKAVEVYRIKSREGVIFFQVYIFSDESTECASGGLYQYDVAAGECSMIKSNLIGPYSVINDVVYYGNEEGLCRYSIQEGTTEILTDRPMMVPNIMLTKESIILYDQMGDGTLTAFDYEGVEILNVSSEVKLLRFFGGNADMLFGEGADDKGRSLLFLDLNRPATELRWEELREK
ncbi:MAG: hypothetical protein K2K87_06060 [Lachnospiraceae bacterium]|nr:hypothetical protein [Lachnospiraceae bacterium]